MANLSHAIEGCTNARNRVDGLSFTETRFLGMGLAPG
ncbi:hypothetical protein OKW29_008129 [Paraburkholderia sp. CI3]